MLSSVQRTTYLGVVWDSTTMPVYYLDRVDPYRSHESERRPVTHCHFRRCLHFTSLQEMSSLHFTHCQAVSETAGANDRCVQHDIFWPAVHETPTVVAQDQRVLPRNPLRMLKVTRRCLRALDMWRKPWFLSEGSDVMFRTWYVQ